MVATRSKEVSDGTITAHMTQQKKRASTTVPSLAPAAKQARPVAVAAANLVRPVAAIAKSNPRFKPRPVKHREKIQVPLVDGKVPRGSSILIIQQPWIDLILNGYKTLEIRGKQCVNKVGQRIYLALSGGGGILLGSVEFIACHGPLSRAEWAARGEEHACAERLAREAPVLRAGLRAGAPRTSRRSFFV